MPFNTTSLPPPRRQSPVRANPSIGWFRRPVGPLAKPVEQAVRKRVDRGLVVGAWGINLASGVRGPASWGLRRLERLLLSALNTRQRHRRGVQMYTGGGLPPVIRDERLEKE